MINVWRDMEGKDHSLLKAVSQRNKKEVNFPSLGLFSRQLCADSHQSAAAVRVARPNGGPVVITGTIVFTSYLQPTNFTETTPA